MFGGPLTLRVGNWVPEGGEARFSTIFAVASVLYCAAGFKTGSCVFVAFVSLRSSRFLFLGEVFLVP